MYKKNMLLIFFMVIFVGILPYSVYAQENSFGSAAGTIQNLFESVPNLITLEKLIGEDASAMFWARFLIWLLMFAGVYFGAGFVFREGTKTNTRIAGTVAFAFAAISAFMIPNNVITAIFQTYGWLTAILIWIVPVIAGLFLTSRIQSRLARALVYLLIVFILVAIDNAITSSIAPGLEDRAWYPFFRLLVVVLIIAFLWNLIMAGFEEWTPGTGPEGQPPWAGGGQPPQQQPQAQQQQQPPEPPPGPGQPGARPPGPLPPPTPPSRNPRDPRTPDGVVPPGINPSGPGPRPTAPRLPKQPPIPDDRQIIMIDLSEHFMPIRSQDRLGACSAFAVTSIFEYILHVGFKTTKFYLSPLFLWYRTRETIRAVEIDTGPRTCVIPMQNLVDHGVCFEELWPFADRSDPRWTQRPNQPAVEDGYRKRLISFNSLDMNDPDQWVHALLKKYPINIAVWFPADMAKPYRKPLYDNFGARRNVGGHAMVIVGYHSHYPYNNTGIRAFKIRNSHDVDWGENGYTWVPADVLKSMLIEDPLVILGWKKDEKYVPSEEEDEKQPSHPPEGGGDPVKNLMRYVDSEGYGFDQLISYLRALEIYASNGQYGKAIEAAKLLKISAGPLKDRAKLIERNLSHLKNKMKGRLKDLISSIEKSLNANLDSHTKILVELIIGEKGLYKGVLNLANRESKEELDAIKKIIGECTGEINKIKSELKKILDLCSNPTIPTVPLVFD